MADTIIDNTHPFDYLNDFLTLARSGAAWLERHAKHDEDGIYWDYEPEDGTPGGHSLFSGDGGVALAFLQLWQETGERHYLDVAIEQAEAHVNRWKHGTLSPERAQRGLAGLELIPGNEWSYYLGVTGPAYVLLEVGRNAKRQDLVDAGFAILDDVIAHAKPVTTNGGDGVQWSGEPGILLDGGIIVVLAWAYETFGCKDYAQIIEHAAEAVLAKAVRHDGGDDGDSGDGATRGATGLSWQGLDSTALGAPAITEWPGFEFGTAGVGFLLTRAWQVTGRQEFLDAALQGKAYLESIAVPVGDGRLVPYRTDRGDLFYLGNCHGPAGTSRFAQELAVATGDSQHLDWRDELYRGLVATGAPQTHSAGYWHTSTLCCGTAAITHFGIALWSATGSDEYRGFALAAARQLAGESFLEDGPAHWPDAFVRVEPDYVSSRSSYLAGVAGIVAVLVEAARLTRGVKPSLRLPEDPYPREA